MASCAGVTETLPSAGDGQTKRPFSRRLEKRRALAIEPDHLDQITAPTPENKEVSAERIFGQHLLGQRGEAVEPFSHVSDPGREPNPGLRRDRDHADSFLINKARASGS